MIGDAARSARRWGVRGSMLGSKRAALAAVFIAVATALAAPGASRAQEDGGPAFTSEDLIKSTVRVVVVTRDGQTRWGTGWIISGTDVQNRAGNAIVATSYTNVLNADRVTVIPAGANVQLPARIRSTKRETKIDFDVAFVEVKGLDGPAFKIARDIPDSARPVYSLGYSFISDRNEASRWARSASVQSGTLSKVFEGGMVQQSQAPVDQIEHNTPLDEGYAGGPLVDRCGRVVGLNTKDGGILRLGDMASAQSRGSVFALASDELISVAGQEGVPLEAVPGGACASAQPVAAAAPVAAPPPPPPPKPTGLQAVGDFFRGNPLYLALVVLVALAALGLGVWLLMTGQKPAARAPAPPPTPQPSPGTTVQPAAPVLEISGRGPEGEALSFRFTADELSRGVIIGSDRAKAGVAIDNRATYKVSRAHAKLGFDGRNFTIEDLKSTNKTKLGGVELEPNQPRAVMNGDEVELADVKLRFGVR